MSLYSVACVVMGYVTRSQPESACTNCEVLPVSDMICEDMSVAGGETCCQRPFSKSL
jgi:hypothetical protein